MHSRFHRKGVVSAAFVGLLLAMLAAGPVLANHEFGHTGQVGIHSLRDTRAIPGVTCGYEQVSPSPGGYSWEGKLTRLNVLPPRMQGIAVTSMLGWRFIVQRQQGGAGAWATTYQSPVQKRTTEWDFFEKTVSVTVPTSSYNDRAYVYRVLMSMLWYRSDGSKQGTAKHMFDWYRRVHNYTTNPGPPSSNKAMPCPDWRAVP